MADTTLPAVTTEVTSPTLEAHKGHITATSLQVAEHFAKRHADVIRAINNLDVPDDYRQRNFALTINRVPGPKGALRDEPMFHITRDGFALLAMGFTGQEAMGWKEAYIAAFNAMEAQLRALYVAPLLSQKEFRNGIKLSAKLVLMKQSHSTISALVQEKNRHTRRNLYWQLRQINDTLGIPTEGMEVLLGTDAPALPVPEGGAA